MKNEKLTPLAKALQHEARAEFSLAAAEYKTAGDIACGHGHAERMYKKAEECRERAAAAAFDAAIAAGRLSADPAAANYAGLYMYMGPGRGGDAFKNRVTREYID